MKERVFEIPHHSSLEWTLHARSQVGMRLETLLRFFPPARHLSRLSFPFHVAFHPFTWVLVTNVGENSFRVPQVGDSERVPSGGKHNSVRGNTRRHPPHGGRVDTKKVSL